MGPDFRPMGSHKKCSVPSHPMGQIFFGKRPMGCILMGWDGMGWDRPIPRGALILTHTQQTEEKRREENRMKGHRRIRVEIGRILNFELNMPERLVTLMHICPHILFSETPPEKKFPVRFSCIGPIGLFGSIFHP
jgi:hypothetical protein